MPPVDPREHEASTWLITFSYYRTRPQGDERGWVDRHHNQPGGRFLGSDPQRLAVIEALSSESPFTLDCRRRQVVLSAIIEGASHRGWTIEAAHVRSTHVHVLVTTAASGEKAMNDFKAYSTRRLKSAGFDIERKKRWSRHGSIREIRLPANRVRAIRYVLYGQGEPMAVWPSFI